MLFYFIKKLKIKNQNNLMTQALNRINHTLKIMEDNL
jgi:hypothetical protein